MFYFQGPHYLRHNARRLEHLSSLGLPVREKSVLEVGAGMGDHTHFYLDRGCTVCITEARPELCSYVSALYPQCYVQVLDMDCPGTECSKEAVSAAVSAAAGAGHSPKEADTELGNGSGGTSAKKEEKAGQDADPQLAMSETEEATAAQGAVAAKDGGIATLGAAPGYPFEVCHCYGLLYHLKEPERALRFMAANTSSLLLLETCVSFGEDDNSHAVSEPACCPTQAYSGTGCRPTRVWVFNRLKQLFAHVYVPSTQPNHAEFPIDWRTKAAGGPGTNHAAELQRAVFVASRAPLNNPLLLSELPTLQTRHD